MSASAKSSTRQRGARGSTPPHRTAVLNRITSQTAEVPVRNLAGFEEALRTGPYAAGLPIERPMRLVASSTLVERQEAPP